MENQYVYDCIYISKILIMKKILIFPALVCIGLFSLAYAYTEEQINAFDYAYGKGITNKAKLNDEITRIELAEMMSNYAVNVLWLKPSLNAKCIFYDVDPSVNAQYGNWTTRICQLWLMGILGDWSISDYFYPFNTVSRWQWATIFSRALNKYRGETVVEWNPFYDVHLANLYKKGLIQNVKVPSPTSNEKRWNVLIMMYRTDPNNTVTVNYATGVTKLKAGQIYHNNYYWFEVLSTRKNNWIVNVDKWGSVSLCDFVDKEYERLSLADIYERDFKNTAKNFWESGLVNCTDLAYKLVKKWWSEDIDLSSEIEEGYLGSPYKKIDLNNWYVAFEYIRWRWQEAQYEYERGKYNELLEIENLGTKFFGIDRNLYEYSDKLYNNILSIEWTSSMSIYDNFRLQPIQKNSSKLYQILNVDKVDLSKERNYLESEYRKMISTKNKLRKRKKQYLIENPDFNISYNLLKLKEEVNKMVDENYSSSPIEKLTAIKFFKDEFGIYLVDASI